MDDFNITFSGFISALFLAVSDFGFFVRGRLTNYAFLLIAIGLMSYSYFTTGPLQDWGVGAILCIAAYILRDGTKIYKNYSQSILNGANRKKFAISPLC